MSGREDSSTVSNVSIRHPKVALPPTQHPRNMQLDTDKTLDEIQPSARHMRDAMVDIATLSVGRGLEEEWANKLRLLTPALEYDDLPHLFQEDPNKEWGYESEHASLASDEHWCSCVDRVDRNFSPRDRFFELLPADAVPECVHYLAVSYCWSSSARALYSGEPFKVRVDGVWRDLKCPPALMQRMVVFASWQRRGFIWIDQECIDQEDTEDKQVGIRAMDLVYQQAERSVAVLEVCLTEQRQVDALEIILDMTPQDFLDRETFLAILETLELITSDPWFSRAWCLQEATSGARSMTLLLQYAEGLDVPSTFEIMGNIYLELAELNNLVSSWLPAQMERAFLHDKDIWTRGQRSIDLWFDKNVPNVDTAIDYETHVMCNGIQALHFLEQRQNSVIADRLAILANLCGYDLRLDAAKTEKRGYDFSVSALTLAIINGDITVLAGHYADADKKGKQSMIEADPRGASGHGFSWCPPSHCLLAKSAFFDQEDDVQRVDVVSLTPQGLQVMGCIWTADLELDLASIRESMNSIFDQKVLEQALISSYNDLLAQELEASVRRVRATVLTELICHLFTSDLRPLAEQIWSNLRRYPTARELASSEEIRAYGEATLEDIIDIEGRVHKWKRPIPPSFRSYAQLDDSFATLQHTFALVLVNAVINNGSLVVARPIGRAAEPGSCAAVFDTAHVGDFFFTPRYGLGDQTPPSQYGCTSWLPRNWRLQPPKDIAAGFDDTASCQGLVGGNWRFGKEDLSGLYLI